VLVKLYETWSKRSIKRVWEADSEGGLQPGTRTHVFEVVGVKKGVMALRNGETLGKEKSL